MSAPLPGTLLSLGGSSTTFTHDQFLPAQALQPFPVDFSLNESTARLPSLPPAPPSPLAPLPLDLFEPSTAALMCPFCDKPLPGTVFSKELAAILNNKHVIKGTYKAPNERNPNHRESRTNFTIYISFCVQHDFEMKMRTDAEEKGWLMDPDFESFPVRIQGLSDKIKTFVIDGILDVRSEHHARLVERFAAARTGATISNFDTMSCG